MKKFFQSLLAKYMLIILMALFLVQLSFLVIGTLVMGVADTTSQLQSSEDMINPDVIENKWHEEAKSIENSSKERVNQLFAEWKRQYPESSMFWVNEDGELEGQLGLKKDVPTQWTPVYTAKFIKERYGGDPFTVIAFLGNDETNGFIVLELPRELFQPIMQEVYDEYGTILLIGMIAIIFIFISVSFLFFRSIRKRLVRLQESMTTRDVDGLPIETEVKKEDEVGQLEQTFNEMIQELRESKQREQEEEQLRRELIANLSHDLRTPLTKIRAQTFSLSKEALTGEGRQAIKVLETSVINIDRLIDNLMSYTLLMASKYKLERKEIDVVRYIRECLATWYPVFEKEEFEIEIELHPFENNIWQVDPIWLERIIDNLLQNVLRHARTGQYVKVTTESTNHFDAIVIIDRGKGMNDNSNEKGAGIGLSIIDMMVKGLELQWEIESNQKGTTVKVMKLK